MSLSRGGKRLLAVLVASATGAITFALGEIYLRMRLTGSLDRGPSFRDYGSHFTYMPMLRDTLVNEEGIEVAREHDEHGLRNPPGRLADADVILVGDSFTAARYSPRDQTLAGRLEAEGHKVYNAGVGGYSSYQALALLKSLLPEARPTHVVLVFYLGNDFRDNYVLPRGTVSAARKALLSVAASSYLLTVLRERVWLGWIRGWERHPHAAFGLAELAALRQPVDPWVEGSVELTIRALREFRALGETRGFAFQVIGIPSKAQVYRSFRAIDRYSTDPRMPDAAEALAREPHSFDAPDSLASLACARAGVPYQSLLPLFRARSEDSLYFGVDIHWTGGGQALAALFVDSLLRPRIAEGNP